MKQMKQFKYFKYTISDNQIVEFVDLKKPISLKYNSNLINRIHNRYPFITKYEVGIITKTCFSIMRALLIKNKILYFSSFIGQMFVLFSKKNNNGSQYVSLKVNVTTPNASRCSKF